MLTATSGTVANCLCSSHRQCMKNATGNIGSKVCTSCALLLLFDYDFSVVRTGNLEWMEQLSSPKDYLSRNIDILTFCKRTFAWCERPTSAKSTQSSMFIERENCWLVLGKAHQEKQSPIHNGCVRAMCMRIAFIVFSAAKNRPRPNISSAHKKQSVRSSQVAEK